MKFKCSRVCTLLFFFLTYPVFCLMILTMIQHGILLEKNLNFSSKAARHSGSKWYIVPPPPEFFANIRVSALSLNKKQSSTYNKYACGCFLYAPSIYSAYLQKGRLHLANSKSASPISQKDCYKKANRKTILKNNFRQGAGDFK